MYTWKLEYDAKIGRLVETNEDQQVVTMWWVGLTMLKSNCSCEIKWDDTDKKHLSECLAESMFSKLTDIPVE